MTNTSNDDAMFPTARDIVYEKNKDKTALRSKVMQLRLEIKQQGFKKGGHNKFQHYDHYTIDDILEVAYPLLFKYHLSTWYDFNVETRVASLEVTDLDTGYTDIVSIEDPIITWKNSNEVLQGLGKSQTYLRKYLYIQFLDISENDPDSSFGEITEQSIHSKQLQNTNKKEDMKNNTKSNQIKHSSNTSNQNSSHLQGRYIPQTIQYIITELEEKNIKPTRKTLRDYTKKQLEQKIITQKEYNALQNTIQKIPELT